MWIKVCKYFYNIQSVLIGLAHDLNYSTGRKGPWELQSQPIQSSKVQREKSLAQRVNVGPS